MTKALGLVFLQALVVCPIAIMDKIKINEIFHSIQGETSYTGQRSVFVRTSGCHLRCNYCDTTYAYYEGHKKTIEEIIDTVNSYQVEYVCVSGGEPLLQKGTYKLMKELCDLGYKVSLETSGDIDCKDVDPRVKKIIDIKTPDSGEADTFNLNNLEYRDNFTEYKFVICSEKDLLWAEDFVDKHKLLEKNNVLYSPSYGKISERWLAEQIVEKKSKVRLQLQLHKYIWPEAERGV